MKTLGKNDEHISLYLFMTLSNLGNIVKWKNRHDLADWWRKYGSKISIADKN